jgi:rhodanese-related sulfurtransferase
MHHSTATMGQRVPHAVCASRRAVVGLVSGLLLGCSQAHSPDQITLEQARQDHEAGRVTLIDLREPDEHARGVAPGAIRLPLSQLSQRWREIPTDAQRPVYLICATQNRSRAALSALREQGGYEHVKYVHGGMTGWAARGWPLTPP